MKIKEILGKVKEKLKNLGLGAGIVRNLKVFSLISLVLLAIAMSTTDITDQSINTPDVTSTTATFDNLTFDLLKVDVPTQTDESLGNILNEIRYTQINGSVNNTDLFTIRGDVYSPDPFNAQPYGYRNLVSRVNTYLPTDVANVYNVWNDYGNARGAVQWNYIYEQDCDPTYTDCTNGVFNPKYGLVLRFANLTNGTDKEGLRIENQDNDQSVDTGIRFLGNYTTGILAASTQAESGFSNAFIDINVNSTPTAAAIKITQTGEGSGLTITETTNTGLGNAITISSKRNNATVFIDNPLRGAETAWVTLADLQNTIATNGTNIFYRNLVSTSTVSPVVGIIQAHASDDQPALNIEGFGTVPTVRIISPNAPALNLSNNLTFSQGGDVYSNGSCTIITGSTSTLEVC